MILLDEDMGEGDRGWVTKVRLRFALLSRETMDADEEEEGDWQWRPEYARTPEAVSIGVSRLVAAVEEEVLDKDA